MHVKLGIVCVGAGCVTAAWALAEDLPSNTRGLLRYSPTESVKFCSGLSAEVRMFMTVCKQPKVDFPKPVDHNRLLTEFLAQQQGVYVLQPAPALAAPPRPAPTPGLVTKPYGSTTPPGPDVTPGKDMSPSRQQEIAAVIAGGSWQGYKIGTSIAYNELTQADIAKALARSPSKMLSPTQNEAAAKVAYDAAKQILSKSGARKVMFLVAVGAGAYAAYQFVRGEDDEPVTAPAGETSPPATSAEPPSATTEPVAQPPAGLAPDAVSTTSLWRMQDLGQTSLPDLKVYPTPAAPP